MKNYLQWIAMMLACFIAGAQNTDYADRMEHVFENIDPDKVTTGFLKDYGISLAYIEAANGQITSENQVNRSQFVSLHNSLYTMRVGNINTGMLNPSQFTDALNTAVSQNEVDVVLSTQHYRYERYREDAYTSGAVKVVNDQIFDVPGRNPYNTHTLFAAAALTQEVKGSTMVFILPSDLMFKTKENAPSLIKINFDDGNGFKEIDPDVKIPVTYTKGGIKTITVQYMMPDETTVSSHTRIVLDYEDPNVQPRFNGSGRSVRTVIGAAWEGESASGIVTVELAPGRTQLTKPLIVVEGFDPNDDFNYFDFIDDSGPGGLNIVIDDSSSLTLNQAIEDEGYDLVFVDYVNSLDYIQRNALMVEQVIREVNTAKLAAGSTEKNVVLGISMGGLVARYALRDMEMEGEMHETKLYISHDSPHQGANVPLSVQALVRNLVGEDITLPILFGIFDAPIFDIVDEFEELEEALDLLESPAAQQMLTYQLQGTGASINHITGNTLHDDFLNEYQAMGYPQQANIRNIAISNSTDCGTPLDFEPYDELIDFDEELDVASDLEFVLFGIADVIFVTPLRGLSSILSTKREIKAKFKCNALPSQEFKRIYNGRVYVKKQLLGFIDINEDIMERGAFHSLNTMLPLDSANGGVYDIETFASIPSSFENSVLESRFSFIPVYSSLDVGQGNVSIQPTDLTRIYDASMPPPAPKNIPFDNFHANPFISQAHTQFTSENGNWLISELSENPEVISCTIFCETDSWEITGPDTFCGSAIFSVPAGAPEYNWSYPGIINTPDPSQPNVVEVEEWLNGYSTLSVNFGDYPDCGITASDTRISKRVWAGVPEAGGDLVSLDPSTLLGVWPSGSYCDEVGFGLRNIPFIEQVDGIEWELVSGQSNWDGPMRNGTRIPEVVFYPECDETVEFRVRYSNDCGYSEWTSYTVDLDVCGSRCQDQQSGISGNNFTLFPNPADEFLRIDKLRNPAWDFPDCPDDPTTISPVGGNECDYYVYVEIYDWNSTSVFSTLHRLGDEIDISGLLPGTYIIHISMGSGQLEQLQIIIE
ncbi:MAG: hypothetical protein WBG46_10940 [Nonlabens sp.]